MERNFFESFGSLGDEVSALQLKVEQHLAREIDSSLPFLFRMSSNKKTLGTAPFDRNFRMLCPIDVFRNLI